MVFLNDTTRASVLPIVLQVYQSCYKNRPMRRYTCGHTIKKHQAEALQNCDHWIDFVLSSRIWLNGWAAINFCLKFYVLICIFLCFSVLVHYFNLRSQGKNETKLILLGFATCMGFQQKFYYIFFQDVQPVCVPQLRMCLRPPKPAKYYPIAKKIGTTGMIHASLWLGRSRRSLSIRLVWDPNRDENDRTYRIWSKWFVLQNNAHAKSLLIVFEWCFYVWLEVKLGEMFLKMTGM